MTATTRNHEAIFNAIQAAAQKHYRRTRDFRMLEIVMAAENNAMDVQRERRDWLTRAEWFQAALGSLESNLSDRAHTEAERRFFRKHGAQI